MANFKKKYYYEFTDFRNIDFVVEIWQDTINTITAEKITGIEFTIEYSEVNVFDSVRGSGAKMVLLSSTDRKFLSLYTANILEYQVRVYKANSLIWIGYLDSENYNESFNEYSNYPVSFNCSDGFALLERINYSNSDGSKYIGIISQWQVIQNIINKLGLTYNNIYVSLSTACTDFSLNTNETIFHKTYSNNQNWINEDNESETSRTVLEAILKPYSAYIIQNEGNLYITDINTIAGANNANFKRYNSNFSYICDEVKYLNLGDLATIGFANNNQEFNVCSGKNKQVITYSPYINNSIIDYKEEVFSGTTTNTNYGTLKDTWTRKYYQTSTYWNKLSESGKFCEMVGTNDNASTAIEKYLVITPIAPELQSNNEIFTYKGTIPDIVFSQTKQYYIKLDCSAYVRTLEEKSSLTPTLKISQLKVKTNLTIGNKRFRYDADFGSSIGWYPVEQPQHHLVMNFTNVYASNNSYAMGNITDTWTNASIGYIDVVWTGGNNYTTQIRKSEPLYIPIPLNSAINGNAITFSIGDYKVYDNAANRTEITTQIQDIRLKDIKLTIVDENYKAVENADLEYIGLMNPLFKNEGDNVKILQGTSVNDNPIEKGSLMGYTGTNYYHLKNWIREGKTDILENLLLRSIKSNDQYKTQELTCTIKAIPSSIGCLTYSQFLQDKNFMIVSSSYNLADATQTLKLREIKIDSLDINKVYE